MSDPTTNSIIGIVMGILSFILSQFYTFPQLYKLCKTRNTSGIALWTYIVYIVTSCFWTVWSFGFFYEQIHLYTYETCGDGILFIWSMIPAIILNICDIVIMCIIIAIKINHILICRKQNITELQLSDELLSKFNSVKNNRIFKQYYLFVLGIISVVLPTICVITYLILTYNLDNFGKLFIWITIINILASLTWEAVNWPQFIKTMRIKDTSGISMFWAIFMFVSSTVTFLYDLTLALIGGVFNWQVIGGLICCGIVPSLAFLILKSINLIKAKKLCLSELEYTKKYLY